MSSFELALTIWNAYSKQASAAGPLSPVSLPTIEQEDDMRDELFDRDYQDGRDALNQGIGQLILSSMAAFRTLSAIQFDAPWKRRRPSGLPGCG